MVVTMLEAKVESDRVDDLQRTHRELASELPPIVRETFLVQDRQDDALWKMITVWSSREELEEMQEQARTAGTKPTGVLVFEAAGAAPMLTVLDVVRHVTH